MKLNGRGRRRSDRCSVLILKVRLTGLLSSFWERWRFQFVQPICNESSRNDQNVAIWQLSVANWNTPDHRVLNRAQGRRIGINQKEADDGRSWGRSRVRLRTGLQYSNSPWINSRGQRHRPSANPFFGDRRAPPYGRLSKQGRSASRSKPMSTGRTTAASYRQ